MKRALAFIVVVLLVVAQSAKADIKINEIYVSPEDPKDDRQFFEIINTAGAGSLNNVWFLEVEGDFPIGSLMDNPGTVLNAFDLSSFSTGTNGLFLWRDSNTTLDTSPAPGVQGPDAATVVNTAAFTQIFQYKGPTETEYENDVHTFLLVEGFSEGEGFDLDPDDDGNLSTSSWTTVLDAISLTEEEKPGWRYADQVGGLDINSTFGADFYAREPDAGSWLFFDSSSGDGEPAGFAGPFFANDGAGPGDSDAVKEDGTEIVVYPTSMYLYATPGAANVDVPEPSSLVLFLAAGVLALCGRLRVLRCGR